MDWHEELRRKLDLFPIGLPRMEETMKILRLLFSEEDARIAAHVPNPPLLFTAKAIAGKAGVYADDAARALRGMAERGLIVEQKFLVEFRYTLMPAVPGFMEMQFMKGQVIDEKRREAGELWHKALAGEFGEENYGYPTSGVRTLPVRKTIGAGQRVFSFEEADRVARASGSIAVAECACRKSARKCDAPLEVCMFFGMTADYLVGRDLARKLTPRQAAKNLEMTSDAGLVHVATNTKPPVSIICSCCSCCCASLRGVVSLNKPASSVASNFRAESAPGSKCVLCGVCAKACPADAITMGAERAEVSQDRCIGCGVCAHKCPAGALTLVRKTKETPFPTSLHLTAKMMTERNKLGGLLESIAKDLL